MIVGILAAMGMTQYSKTMEVARAEDALAVTRSVANANRMFQLDNGRYIAGPLTCDPNAAFAESCSATTSACALLHCGYLAKQDMRNKAYDFFACDPGTASGCCQEGAASCATRNTAAQDPYKSWGFAVTKVGITKALAEDQPKPQ